MLKVYPAYTDTSAWTTTPLADSGINDRLVTLRPLIDQTCMEFTKVSCCHRNIYIYTVVPLWLFRCLLFSALYILQQTESNNIYYYVIVVTIDWHRVAYIIYCVTHSDIFFDENSLSASYINTLKHLMMKSWS